MFCHQRQNLKEETCFIDLDWSGAYETCDSEKKRIEQLGKNTREFRHVNKMNLGETNTR